MRQFRICSIDSADDCVMSVQYVRTCNYLFIDASVSVTFLINYSGVLLLLIIVVLAFLL